MDLRQIILEALEEAQEERICTLCNETKPIEKFISSGEKRKVCNDCKNLKQRQEKEQWKEYAKNSNERRICIKCNESKPLINYTQKYSRVCKQCNSRDPMAKVNKAKYRSTTKGKETEEQYKKKWIESGARGQYYTNRRESGIEKEQRGKSIKRNRSFIKEEKAKIVCSECKKVSGKETPYLIDYHHNDPSLKKEKLSTLANKAYSLDVIKNELALCTPVCCNCHRGIHKSPLYKFSDEQLDKPVVIGSDNGKSYRVGISKKELIKYKRKISCSSCGVSNKPWTLDFDHKNPSTKYKAITTMVNQNYPWNEVLGEIHKCEVLCGNCHRIRHYRKTGEDESEIFGNSEEKFI